MKLLVVVRNDAGASLFKAAESANKLFALCGKLGFSADAYFYSSTKNACPEQLSCPDGCTVFTQEVAVISPGSIAVELKNLIINEGYRGVVVSTDDISEDIATLLSGFAGFELVTKIIFAEMRGSTLYCRKLVYNNIIEAEFSLDSSFVVSERLPTLREQPPAKNPDRYVELPKCPKPNYIKEQQVLTSAEGKAQSSVLIVAGMGIKSRFHIEKLRKFAKENDFDFGVTRPVAMRGWACIDEIIGVSGTIYSPKLTITLGVSGSAAFFVGIEQSEYILSVNTNPNATISRQSDALIADDYENLLDELFSCLTRYRIEDNNV